MDISYNNVIVYFMGENLQCLRSVIHLLFLFFFLQRSTVIS